MATQHKIPKKIILSRLNLNGGEDGKRRDRCNDPTADAGNGVVTIANTGGCLAVVGVLEPGNREVEIVGVPADVQSAAPA